LRDGALTNARPGLQQRIQTLADSLADWLADGGEMKGVV
jgi:hypothetical protein